MAISFVHISRLVLNFFVLFRNTFLKKVLIVHLNMCFSGRAKLTEALNYAGILRRAQLENVSSWSIIIHEFLTYYYYFQSPCGSF